MTTLVTMSIDSTMALRDVKAHLSEVVDQVETQHDRVTITRHGKPAAVVISADDLSSLEETLQVLSNERSMERIRRSRAEHEAGDSEALTKDEALALIRGDR